jgi:DNA-binding transcriptional ArsR family regulator
MILLINRIIKFMAHDPLSTAFGALADPTRRALLARLALGEASVNELAAQFDISLPAVSRHLKVLAQAGFITRTREAQWRRCALRGDTFAELAGWIEQYRRFWESQFDALDAYLRSSVDEPPGAEKKEDEDGISKR